jgi:hypothetical protein
LSWAVGCGEGQRLEVVDIKRRARRFGVAVTKGVVELLEIH